VSFQLDEISEAHFIVRFTWLDLVSHIGGVAEMLVFVFGILVFPIS